MVEMIAFDKRPGHIWYNGEMVEWQDAKIHVLNHGLHYASSVFEGIAVYNHKIFKLREHIERLFNSAKILDFEIPYNIPEIEEATRLIVAKQGIKDGYIRPFAWRGSEKMAISASGNKIHTAIASWTWPPYFSPESKKRGINMVFADYQRPAPNTAPFAAKAAGLYMICTISKHIAERSGYEEAFMLDYRGFVAEATSANMFFISGDELHTPIPDCFLNGITRQTVIELAKRRNIRIIERHILPEELANFTDAFLTGTAAEITRVNVIDNQDKSKSYKFAPHKITLQLIDDYAREIGRSEG